MMNIFNRKKNNGGEKTNKNNHQTKIFSQQINRHVVLFELDIYIVEKAIPAHPYAVFYRN